MIHLGYINIILFKFNSRITKTNMGFYWKNPLGPMEDKKDAEDLYGPDWSQGPFPVFFFFSLSSDIAAHQHYIQRTTPFFSFFLFLISSSRIDCNVLLHLWWSSSPSNTLFFILFFSPFHSFQTCVGIFLAFFFLLVTHMRTPLQR